jgi:hypothetical protein
MVIAAKIKGIAGVTAKSTVNSNVIINDTKKAIPPIEGVGILCIFLLPGKSCNCLVLTILITTGMVTKEILKESNNAKNTTPIQFIFYTSPHIINQHKHWVFHVQ